MGSLVWLPTFIYFRPPGKLKASFRADQCCTLRWALLLGEVMIKTNELLDIYAFFLRVVGLSGFSWTMLAGAKLSWQAAVFMVSRWSPQLLRSQEPQGFAWLVQDWKVWLEGSEDISWFQQTLRMCGRQVRRGLALNGVPWWCSGLIHAWTYTLAWHSFICFHF